MNLVRRNGHRMLVFPALEAAGLTCAVSTRPLDVKASAQRTHFVAALTLDPARAVSPHQMHHAEVLRVEGEMPSAPEVDALITDEPGRALVLRAADCSLIVVADPAKRAVGVAHAGWKGSARGVVVNLVKAMRETFDSDPAKCLAAVGPTISQRRYPVGHDVPAAFLRYRSWASRFVEVIDGVLHFDLSGVNTQFLVESGIPRDSIEVSGLCTFESSDLLHSFRRDGMDAGHHGLAAAWA